MRQVQPERRRRDRPQRIPVADRPAQARETGAAAVPQRHVGAPGAVSMSSAKASKQSPASGRRGSRPARAWTGSRLTRGGRYHATTSMPRTWAAPGSAPPDPAGRPPARAGCWRSAGRGCPPAPGQLRHDRLRVRPQAPVEDVHPCTKPANESARKGSRGAAAAGAANTNASRTPKVARVTCSGYA